jgi:hypothetical protein
MQYGAFSQYHHQRKRLFDNKKLWGEDLLEDVPKIGDKWEVRESHLLLLKRFSDLKSQIQLIKGE